MLVDDAQYCIMMIENGELWSRAIWWRLILGTAYERRRKMPGKCLGTMLTRVQPTLKHHPVFGRILKHDVYESRADSKLVPYSTSMFQSSILVK